jgi:hypothetical protein
MLNSSVQLIMRQSQQKSKKEEVGFKRLVVDSGLSLTAAEELWKWYNPSDKKGVASF